MSLFFPPPSSLHPPPPPPLASLFLEPLSPSAHRLAVASPAALLAALSRGPLATGDVLDLSDDLDGGKEGGVKAFRVVMTEPALVGCYQPAASSSSSSSSLEQTQVVVSPFVASSSSSTKRASSPARPPKQLKRSPSSLSSSSNSSNSTIHPAPPSSNGDLEEDGEDDDLLDLDFDISEGFLQNAMLGNGEAGAGHGGGGRRHVLEGRAAERRGGGDKGDVGWVRTKELGEMGAFDGDWVAIRSVGQEDDSADRASDAGDWRLVRIQAADHSASSSSAPSISLPPLLLSNLSLSPLSSSPFSSPQQFQLQPTPFAPSPIPPLPTAASVTLARVASPASTSRVLQSRVLRALREFFEGERVVVKVGDLIGVGVAEGEDEEDGGEGRGPSGAAIRPTTPVFFQVTHVVPPTSSSASPSPSPPSSSSSSSSTSSSTWSARASSGLYGHLISPCSTHLIQSGLVHRPGLGLSFPSWLGIPTPSTKSKAAAKLEEILGSVTKEGMGEYGVDLSLLVHGARGSGKRTLVRSASLQAGLGVFEVNAFDWVGESDVKTEGAMRAAFERAAGSAPCVMLVRNVEALARKGQVMETGQEPQIAGALRECVEGLGERWRKEGWGVLVVGTSSEGDKIPSSILSCFKNDVSLEAPDEKQRKAILVSAIAGDLNGKAHLAADVDLDDVAVQTAALVAGDLVELVERAKGAAIERASRSSAPLESLALSRIALTSLDFQSALGAARSAYSASIGAPRIPDVRWEDVGGLVEVKKEILDTVELPLKRPEMFGKGLKKRSGVLLYGPPGTGKTLLAKAVATSCSLNFFSIKGPELLNMYIGESEANVRRVFQRARDASPCVVFFDELDSVAPKRGNQGDSGGVMDRIVSQLLAELDGMSEEGGGKEVFVIGATNRPDLLDPALLRPGRFDRMLYLGVPSTHPAQLSVLQALTRKFALEPDLDLAEVADRCPFNYTGADLYALCADAMLNAMTRKALEVDESIAALNAEPTSPVFTTQSHPHPLTPQYYLSELATPSEKAVRVGKGDFERALEGLVPSVSEGEMEHYRRVQAEFSAPPKKEETEKGKGKGKGRAE